MRCIRSYEAEGEDMLKLAVGEVAFVVNRKGNNWVGVYKGTQGLIPADAVEDATEKKVTNRPRVCLVRLQL